jgi:hypothetical protein
MLRARGNGAAGTDMILNLFYEEPDSDRWLPWDRYPRRVFRRLVRGRRSPSGQTRVFLNLIAGLNRAGIRYRVNDYRYVQRHPHELACIIGKSCVLNRIEWKNPILLGTAIEFHAADRLNLFREFAIQKVLVPGDWVRVMFEGYWTRDALSVWPVGIDSDLWQPVTRNHKVVDVLLYDKVRWEHEHYEATLIRPIRNCLERSACSYRVIRYGSYVDEDFRSALAQSRVMIFLCEHETQGIAYQQALSSGVPVMAWDRGGIWRDPGYFPHKVIFEPVTSVPYWDERCGMKFSDIVDFERIWNTFWKDAVSSRFAPRDYIPDNLTLERCARHYLEIANSVMA